MSELNFMERMDQSIQSLNPAIDTIVNGYSCGDSVDVLDYQTFEQLTDNEKIMLLECMKSLIN